METSSSSAQAPGNPTHGRFHTVVPTVARFPLAIVVFSCFLLAINAFGLFKFFTDLSGFIPGIGSGPAVDQLAFMISARQLGAALVLLFALFYKNVRVMQFAWFVAIIREVGDLSAMLIRGDMSSSVFVIVILIAEVATFIYLGMIASGKVAKYARSNR
ncbi:MAG: hypothetical protein HY617_02975 [Candidatus Sungbacteria bacterium]|nr:hypothetical protein [Candidatus Sungbacteria bacterium]